MAGRLVTFPVSHFAHATQRASLNTCFNFPGKIFPDRVQLMKTTKILSLGNYPLQGRYQVLKKQWATMALLRMKLANRKTQEMFWIWLKYMWNTEVDSPGRIIDSNLVCNKCQSAMRFFELKRSTVSTDIFSTEDDCRDSWSMTAETVESFSLKNPQCTSMLIANWIWIWLKYSIWINILLMVGYTQKL